MGAVGKGESLELAPIPLKQVVGEAEPDASCVVSGHGPENPGLSSQSSILLAPFARGETVGSPGSGIDPQIAVAIAGQRNHRPKLLFGVVHGDKCGSRRMPQHPVFSSSRPDGSVAKHTQTDGPLNLGESGDLTVARY